MAFRSSGYVAVLLQSRNNREDEKQLKWLMNKGAWRKVADRKPCGEAVGCWGIY